MHARSAAAITPLMQVQFPADWLGALSSLIKGLKRCEFDTVDALLGAVAGDDPTAGLMLKRVLHWHNSKSGGEFYLSQRDWWRQCRVHRKTVDRVKTKIFPLCGITSVVKSTGTGKATHYRLHEWKFMRRLAQVIGLPLPFVLDRVCPKWTDGYARNGQMGTPEMDAPLTIESTIKTAIDVVKNNVVPSKKIVDFKTTLPESTPEQLRVIELLKKAHVPGQSAVSFALLPESVVQDCIASAQSAFEAKRTKNRVGYLIGALRKQLTALKAQAAPPPNVLTAQSDARRSASSEGELDAEDGDFADSHQSWLDVVRRLREPQVVEAEPVNERLLVKVNERGRMTAQDAWSAAYHQLELQLDRASFDTWLRQAKLQDYENDVFVVGVHSTYARDMLQHRFYRNVARILRDVTGRDVTVRFEVEGSHADTT